MKILIELDLNREDQTRLLTNSIERFLNNAKSVGMRAETSASKSPTLAEDASILWQDAEELKPLLDRLWSTTAEALRKGKANA